MTPDDQRSQPRGDAAPLGPVVRARQSCRAFLPRPVPRATIEAILAIAQHTASWNNCQPWHIVIAGAAALERFRAAIHARAESGAAAETDFPFPREYREPYLSRRRACGFQLYAAVGIERGDKAAYRRQSLENFKLFGAPHVALISTDEALGTYGAVDCGGYITTFMLAAEAHGVATIAQAALAVHAPFVRRHFGMPDHLRLVSGIAFGYADRGHPLNGYRTPREPIADAVTWREE